MCKPNSFSLSLLLIGYRRCHNYENSPMDLATGVILVLKLYAVDSKHAIKNSTQISKNVSCDCSFKGLKKPGKSLVPRVKHTGGTFGEYLVNSCHTVGLRGRSSACKCSESS